MTSLYNMVKEYKDALDFLNEIEDIDQQTIEDTLSVLNLSINEKVSNTSFYILHLLSDVNEIDNLMAQLSARKNRIEKKISFLKEYVKFSMKSINKQKIELSFFDVKIRNNQPAVKILDESLIDSRFIKVKEIKSFDLVAIKNAIKAGETINGVELVSSESLVIK